MSENIEQFKAAFRQSQWCADMRGLHGMSDPEIFERANSERTFYKIQTNDAWRVWRLASIRAARIVMRNVGISEIRDMIMGDDPAPRPDRNVFEAEFKKTGWYKMHVESDDMLERDRSTGEYYSPLVSLAWKFYELGVK